MKDVKALVLILLVVGSILVIASCGNQCSNPEAEAFFDTHIQNIEMQLQKTEIVSGQSMLSVLILQKATGVESSVQFGDTSVYDSDTDMELDKHNWMLWLDENICHIQASNLNAIEHDVKIKHPYFTDSAQ